MADGNATLQVEWVPIGRLYTSPANPRTNDDAVPHVAASIRRFGWRQPIVAKPDGEVIAGNTRLKAALSMGVDTVPVTWFDGSDLDATAFQIADNRTHEFSAWNNAELAKLLEQLRAEDALDASASTIPTSTACSANSMPRSRPGESSRTRVRRSLPRSPSRSAATCGCSGIIA